MSRDLDLPDVNGRYVRALCNYQYTYKGEDVCMARDEVYLLLKKATADWWQVIRDGDTKAFFAPRQYLEITDVSVELMKSSLRKKKLHQRHLQHQQQFYEEHRKRFREKEEENIEPDILKVEDIVFKTTSDRLNPVPENLALGVSVDEKQKDYPSVLNPSFWQKLEKKGIKNINPDNTIMADDTVNGRSCSSSQQTYYIPVSDPNQNTVGELSINGRLDCSLSDDSIAASSINKSGSKGNDTVDSAKNYSLSSELESSSSAYTSISSLNNDSRESLDSFNKVKLSSSMVEKAASFDVLQADEDEQLNASETGYRKAASSEELDQRNRRKEVLFQSDRLSHRNRSNSVELKRFDNNLDLSDSEKLTSLEKNRKCRISRDPMNRRRSWALNDSYSLNSYCRSRHDNKEISLISDIPPKLPPKLRKSKENLLSKSTDNLRNIIEPVDIRVEEVKQRESWKAVINKHKKYLQESAEGSQESINSLMDIMKERKPIALPRRTLPYTVANKPQEYTDVNHHTSTSKSLDMKRSGWDKVRNFVEDEKYLFKPSGTEVYAKEIRTKDFAVAKKDENLVGKESSVEELIEKMESKAKAVENKGKIIQSPPSPTDAPRRIVFDEWGEYVDPESGRPFYYNTKTHEKRWKPPRKSVYTTAMSESPPTSKHDGGPLNLALKAVKFPSPTCPVAPQVPLWPHREKSFTAFGIPTVTVSGLPASLSSVGSSSSTLPASSVHSGSGSISKGSNTLPAQPGSPGKEVAVVSPSYKSSKSFFSSISAFMKHGTTTTGSTSSSPATSPHNMSLSSPPQIPNSAKPPLSDVLSSCPASPVVTESSPTFSLKGKKSEFAQQLLSLQLALEQFYIPKGWIRKYDALSQQIYFQSLVTGEKWNPAIDKSGVVYVYSPNTGESKWNLQEYESDSPSSPSTPLAEREKPDEPPVKEDVLLWRFNLRNGKKAKKTWSKSYANYYPYAKKNVFGKTFGYITFSKKPNDYKKYDQFDLIPPCYIDSNLKKPNTICLHNGEDTEVLLQADSANTSTEWTKLLIDNDKVQEKTLSSDKDRRATKGPDKTLTKKDSTDELDSNKGIKDTLMLFFKKRIQQETLTKRGIYKDTVFGSTIGDLCQKEQLNIPMFVLQCIKNIEKNQENFKVDGLYRISGNASRIQKIRIEIAQNRYAILEDEKDVHNLTGSLKLFFRELKEPLIPFMNYQTFIQATGSEFLKNRPRNEALRQAMKKLPNFNRETLKLLLRHLLKVNEFEKINRMSVMNLAIVFGPCLMWPELTSGYDLMTDAMLHNRVVEALLTDFEDVFKCSR